MSYVGGEFIEPRAKLVRISPHLQQQFDELIVALAGARRGAAATAAVVDRAGIGRAFEPISGAARVIGEHAEHVVASLQGRLLTPVRARPCTLVTSFRSTHQDRARLTATTFQATAIRRTGRPFPAGRSFPTRPCIAGVCCTVPPALQLRAHADASS